MWGETMTKSRIVLKRNLLETTQKAVNRLDLNPEEGLILLNECVGIIMEIYTSFEEESK